MDSNISDYNVLSQIPSYASWGKTRRFLVVLTAGITNLGTAGLVFGFSGLLPSLLKHAVFHDSCSSDLNVTEPCLEQKLALQGMFTYTTAILQFGGFPGGALQDTVGPHKTAGICLLFSSVGLICFGLGGLGELKYLYYLGFFLMGLVGPIIFNCTLTFGSLYPKRSGLITTLFVGGFDASSAMFIILNFLIIQESLSFQGAFVMYSFFPLVASFAALFLWPAENVEAKYANFDKINDGSCSDTLKSSISNPLADLDVLGQIRTPQFFVLLCTVCTYILAINFFIGSCLMQMESVDMMSASNLTAWFAAMLPAGGILYTPFIGVIIDALGSAATFYILWSSYIVFQGLLVLYSESSNIVVIFGAFAIFAFIRPMFYSLSAVIIGDTFGYRHFGKIYGLINTCAGLTNLLAQPLVMMGIHYSFYWSNFIVVCLVFPTVGIPYYFRSPKRTRTNSKINITNIWSSGMSYHSR